MNILIVNRALGVLFGGGESFDISAARQLQRKGHDVTVVTGKPICLNPKNRFGDVRTVYLPVPWLRHYAYASEKLSGNISAGFYRADNLLFELAVERWFRREGRKRDFDIVQCCSLFTLPKRLLDVYRQPVVSWLPGPPSGGVRQRLKTLCGNKHFGLFLRGATEPGVRSIGLERDRDYSVIEPGVDIEAVDSVEADREEMCRTHGLRGGELLGVTIARLVPVKNHCLLLDSIALAKQAGVKWNWVIVGDGPLEKDLRVRAERLGIASHVRFLGGKSHADVHRWLAIADLFALSSNYESFSIATLEAMAHSLPVIGTEVGYLPKLIGGSQSGVVVPANDTGAFSKALVTFSDADMRGKYGANGRAGAENHNWPLIVEKLEHLYRSVKIGTK